jgi:hypothetical protein
MLCNGCSPPLFASFLSVRASPPNRARTRRRPYGGSEVIHQAGAKAGFELWSVSDPEIVNNFAPSASPGYELSSSSKWMNRTRLSNQAGKLELMRNTQMPTKGSLSPYVFP